MIRARRCLGRGRSRGSENWKASGLSCLSLSLRAATDVCFLPPRRDPPCRDDTARQMTPDLGRGRPARPRRGVPSGAGVSRQAALRLACNEPAVDMASGARHGAVAPRCNGDKCTPKRRGSKWASRNEWTIRNRACALLIIPTPKSKSKKHSLYPKRLYPSLSIRPILLFSHSKLPLPRNLRLCVI